MIIINREDSRFTSRMSHGASNSDDLNLTSATTQTIVFRFELSGPPFRTERGESTIQASLRCVFCAALE